MNKNLVHMLKVAEGRYLAEAETSLFQSYYENLPKRLRYSQEVEKAEAAILKMTFDTFYAQHPEMAQMPDSREKGERDMAYLLRTVTTAMVQDEYDEVIPKVKFIFDIFDQLNLSSNTMHDAYEHLRQSLKANVSDEAFEALSSFLNVLHPGRLKAWQEVNDKQHLFVEALKDWVLDTYPQIKQMNEPEENLRKDMHALFNSCAQAMVSQSDKPVEQTKVWLYTYFKGLRFDMDMVYKTYAQGPEIMRGHLSSETMALFEPYARLLSQE